MATKKRENFKDYWENYSMFSPLLLVLDPQYRLQFIMYCFQTLDVANSKLKSKIVKDQMYKLFREYMKEKPKQMRVVQEEEMMT